MYITLLTFTSLFGVGNCANILYLLNVPSPSHFIWAKSLLYSLHERGHNITAISPDIESSKPNFTFLHLDKVYPEIYNGTEEINFFEFNKLGPVNLFLLYADISKKACIGALKSTGYQQLLEYSDDFYFDLAIFDLTMDPCLLGIFQKFKHRPPLIGVSPFHSPGLLGANLLYPAFVPGHDLLYPSEMNFQQRFSSALVHLMEHLMREFYFIPLVDSIVRKQHPNVQYLGDIFDAMKMFFINNQPITDYKQPVFSNQKNVGGLQIKKPKDLPSELKALADNATNGLIYFSLGTNVRGDSLNKETIAKILRAFGRLEKYTFLWKFETKEKLPIELPDNVKIRDWMPQNDILAHKNTKLFISHCGLLSTQEALWHGVPILGFPVFGDQPQNALRMVELGISESISILDFSENELYENVRKMLENSTYETAIARLSKAIRDRPMTPVEEATYWAEWLIRNPDIDLQGAATNLGLFKRHSLDIFTVIILAFLIVFYIKVKVFILLVKCCCSKKKTGVVKSDLSKKRN